MRGPPRFLACCLSVLLCAACSGPGGQQAVPPAVAPVADGWLGRWSGPEATWLEIAAINGAYTVTVTNLDGPRTFAATAAADGLRFERDGTMESITATDGPGTGMKWLDTRRNCLKIRTGE